MKTVVKETSENFTVNKKALLELDPNLLLEFKDLVDRARPLQELSVKPVPRKMVKSFLPKLGNFVEL